MLPSLNFVQYAFFEGGNGFQLTQSFVTNRLSTLARRWKTEGMLGFLLLFLFTIHVVR